MNFLFLILFLFIAYAVSFLTMAAMNAYADG